MQQLRTHGSLWRSSTLLITVAFLIAGAALALFLAAQAAPASADIGLMAVEAVLARQDFNVVPADETILTVGFADGEMLTNTASFYTGDIGLNYQTYWVDTRGEGTGPVTGFEEEGSDMEDAVGANYATAEDAISGPKPQTAPDGTSVAEGVEQNFVLNDGDGRLDLVFESVDLSGATQRTLSFYYWMAEIDRFQPPDEFTVTLDDGTTSVEVVTWGNDELEARSTGSAASQWHQHTVDLEPIITGGLGEVVTLTVGFDSDQWDETIFIDEVEFRGMVPAPDTTISKAVTPTLAPQGGTVTYTITLTNTGDGPDHPDMIDPLPPEVSFGGFVDQPDGAYFHDGDLDVRYYYTLPAGTSVSIVFTVTNHAGDEDVANTATFTGDLQTGSASATFTSYIPTIETSLAKSVRPDGLVAQGDAVTYTLTLSNTGNTADDVTLLDPLPAEVDFGGWISQPFGAYLEESNGAEAVRWTGDLGAGMTVTIIFTATNQAGDGDVTNTAAFSGIEASGDDSATFTSYVPTVDTSITKSVTPEVVATGETVTYTITLANAGNTADTVMLTDTLPAEVTFGEWVEAPAGAVQTGDQITWNGTVPAGGDVTLAFTAINNGGDEEVTNTAAFSGLADSGEESATFTSYVPTVDTSITKSVTPEVVATGETVTYTITLANAGNTDDTVMLTDTLPAEVTFGEWIEAPAGAVQTGDQITWNGTVPAGGDVTFVFTAVNTATADDVINAVEFVGTAQSGTASATFTAFEGVPSTTLAKSVSVNTASPDETVTYTITLANAGDADDTVTLTDTLPSDVTFDAWVEAPTGAEHAAGVVGWSGTVPAGETVSFIFTAINTATSGDVVNTAEFSGIADAGSDSATYTAVADGRIQFLPLVFKNFMP